MVIETFNEFKKCYLTHDLLVLKSVPGWLEISCYTFDELYDYCVVLEYIVYAKGGPRLLIAHAVRLVLASPQKFDPQNFVPNFILTPIFFYLDLQLFY